jgi:predicted aspartyl protease
LGSSLRDGLLDTGADDTILSEKAATALGIDLSQATPHSIGLAARGLIQCRYAEVALRITDGKEVHEWSAVVGFVAAPLHYVLLGHAGFLQFFDVEFRGADQEFRLRTNRKFSGKSTGARRKGGKK